MSNATLIDAERPWPGLLPFTEEAKEFFHGRDTEADDLFRLIERESLTVLFGQSGLGKSSLLNAGVFPRLRRAGYLPVYLRLNLDANAAPLIDQVWHALDSGCLRYDVRATEARPSDCLWRYLHRPDTLFINPHGRPVTPVFAFDQFEEIFTLGRQTPTQSERCQIFLRELGELIENRLPPALEAELTRHPDYLDEFDLLRHDLKLVFTFREDYLAEFEDLKKVIRPIMQNRLRLTAMSGRCAAESIRQSGLELVSDTVAERIVRFVGDAKKDNENVLDRIHVEPALLSLVCRELNEQRIQRQETTISTELIRGDNAQQIIQEFYNKGFTGLNVRVRHFAEDRLLTSAGYRDSCALDTALTELGVNQSDVQTLVDRRILRREERGGLVRLELIHDVLASVAKVSRDARREVEALAEAQRQIVKQKSRQRLMAVCAIFLLSVLAGVSWLAIEAVQARKLATLALGDATRQKHEAEQQKYLAEQSRNSALAAQSQTEEALSEVRRQQDATEKQKLAAEESRNTALAAQSKAASALKQMLMAEGLAKEAQAEARRRQVEAAKRSDLRGTILAYATESGGMALDDAGGGRNGLYTEALLKHIEDRRLSINEVLMQTHAEVARKVAQLRARQSPELITNLNGDIFLYDPPPTRRTFAIVVGNASYRDPSVPPLKNPLNDANDIGRTFRKMGAETIVLLDADQSTIKNAFRDLAERLAKIPNPNLALQQLPIISHRGLSPLNRSNPSIIERSNPNIVVILYFAGFGWEIDGKTYFAPIDVKTEPREALIRGSIALENEISVFQQHAGILVTIFDSCRDNPFGLTKSGR